jgi:hypothetical protein
MGEAIAVEAAIDDPDRRLIAARARALDPRGEVLAEATATLMPAR